MKIRSIIFSAASFALFIASCNADHRYASTKASEAVSTADSAAMTSAVGSVGNTIVEDSAMPLNAPARKIIKTADMRCQVADVFTATTRIERLTTACGGQVSNSRMDNVTDNSRSLPYKNDSLRELTSYTTTAHLTLRIPVTKLDTVLSDIGVNAAFINNRSLNLDDVTLRFLSNKLKNEAMASNDAAQRARKLARRTGDAVNSGDYTDERNDTRIDRKIENLQLNDQVTYASLTLDLYQPQRISQTIVPDIENLMKPTLGQQAGSALYQGWQLMRALVIGMLEIWPLLLLAAVGVVGFRYWRAKRGLRRLAVRT